MFTWIPHDVYDVIEKFTPLSQSCLCVSSMIALVYKADDLREIWSGVPDCGPGAGGPDRSAERH